MDPTSILMYALAGISAVTEIASASAQSSAIAASAAAQEQSVRTQALENEYKINKQKILDIDRVNEQLQENEMRAFASGVSLRSPSFNAIQVDTLQKAQQAMHNGTVFEKINQLSEKSKIASIEDQESWQQDAITFGTIGSLAGLGAQTYYQNKNIDAMKGLSGGNWNV